MHENIAYENCICETVDLSENIYLGLCVLLVDGSIAIIREVSNTFAIAYRGDKSQKVVRIDDLRFSLNMKAYDLLEYIR